MILDITTGAETINFCSLKNCLRNFMANLTEKYQRSAKEIVNESFSGQFYFISSKILVVFSLFYMDLSILYISLFAVTGVVYEADNAYTWSCYGLDQFLTPAKSDTWILSKF